MLGKFVKLGSLLVIMVGLVSQVNASLITGQLVKDANGIDWEYVGQFDLADGPFWNDADDRCINAVDSCNGLFADSLNGIEAAKLLFGILSTGQYATSTIDTSVNRLAWYDLFRNSTIQLGDSILADVGNDGVYSQVGDRSAYVTDRQVSRTNFVFKSVVTSVPFTSTFAMFLLGIFGLSLHRLRS